MKKVIVCGPFVGSFYEEISNFRPLVEWIHENIRYDDLFVFTHFNRHFLYDIKMIPIHEQFSMDDEKFYKHLHKDISPQMYNSMSRALKDDLIHATDYKFKDLVSIFSKYPKTNIKIPNFNKKFSKINIPDTININILNDTIAFIPNKNESKKNCTLLYNKLKEKYNVIVIGDHNCHLQKENILNEKYDMIFKRYEYIIYILSKVKLIVCPVSEWTFLANLQNIPVISWGEDIALYKNNGIYNFNNNNYIIPKTKIDNILSAIKYFKEKIDAKF